MVLIGLLVLVLVVGISAQMGGTQYTIYDERKEGKAAMRISKSTVIVMGFLLVGLCVSPALANSIISFNISVPNAQLSGYTGPYATVSINQSGATAQITFTSLTNGGYIYLMGDGGTADLNVNGAYTLGTPTESSIDGFSHEFDKNVPGNNVDGFGVFTLSLKNKDGFTSSATSISFDLTKASGVWTDASDVLINNDKGYEAAIHAFACAVPGCSTDSSAKLTGYAANGGNVPVPEPATLLLLSSGMFGLWWGLNRWKK